MKKILECRKALATAVLFVMTVAACALEPVKYLNAVGEECSVEKYKVLTGEETMLTRGWYVAKENVKFTHNVELRGNVNIILTDGCMLDVETVNDEPALSVSYIAANLNLYSQSHGEMMGGMRVSSSFGDALCVQGLNVYGGNIEVMYGRGFASEMTIAGGSLTLAACVYFDCANLTVKGGDIKLLSDAQKLNVYGNLTFEKWVDLLSVINYMGTESVVIPEGYVMIIDGVSYRGTIPAEVFMYAYGTNMVYEGTGNTTAVKEMLMAEESIRNGWYTLGGVRLTDKPTVSGIYVHDGRKVVVR